MAQFGALPSGAIGSSAGSVGISNKGSSLGNASTSSSRDRANTTMYDTRPDAFNNVFMDELQSAIAPTTANATSELEYRSTSSSLFSELRGTRSISTGTHHICPPASLS